MKLWHENLRIYYISKTMQSRRQNHWSWRQVNRRKSCKKSCKKSENIRYPCKKSENIGRTIESKIGGGSIMERKQCGSEKRGDNNWGYFLSVKNINSFSMNTKQHKPKDVFPPLIAGLQLLPSNYILLFTTSFSFLFSQTYFFFLLSTKDICCLG